MHPPRSRTRRRFLAKWSKCSLLTSISIVISLVTACGSEETRTIGMGLTTSDAADSPYWIEASAATIFKNTPLDAKNLSDSKKCNLQAEQRIPLTMPPMKMSNGHYFVAMATFQDGCSFSAGYLYQGHVHDTSQPVIHEDASTSLLKIEVKRKTWLRLGTLEVEKQILSEEKCELKEGDSIAVQGPPIAFWEFYMVNIKQQLPGCGFSLGLIPSEDVTIVELPVPPPPQPGHPPRPPDSQAPPPQPGKGRVQAMLDVIGYAEGTGSSYNIRFGGLRFSGYADHPRAIYCSGGLCSDAAGRYQFLSTTWDSARRALGLNSFAPANQDRAAIYLMRSRGVGDLNQITTYNDFTYALWLIRYEWASMPESPYGQPTHSYADLWAVYKRSLNATTQRLQTSNQDSQAPDRMKTSSSNWRLLTGAALVR
jgi:muramidase (phage lysozyme)